MTKQEQVKEILEVIKHCGDYTNRDCAECDYRLYGECKNQKQCEAEALYNEGYRKVPFGATVLAPEERNDEIREMHEILEGRDELIAKVGILGRENYDLKAENKQLKTECALLDDELRIARQETIDVLNKLKAENEELTKVVSSKVYDLIDNTKEIADARDAWEQQAKIDVLNELKTKAFDKDAFNGWEGSTFVVLVRDIDKMIEELQK